MLPEPRCFIRGCLHFRGVKQDVDQTLEQGDIGERVVCDAFTDGIPDKIAYGKNLHLEHVEGDNGILFEKERDLTT